MSRSTTDAPSLPDTSPAPTSGRANRRTQGVACA